MCLFQRKYTWFHSLNMQVEKWRDDESITISASSIRLFGASWKMFGVNLIIHDSSLNNFKLLFSGNRAHPNNELNFRSNLSFSHTSFIYSNYTGQEPLIYLEIANGEFFNITMQNIRAPYAVIINATLNSTVKFLNSHIVNNTLSLAKLSNFSSIFFEDSVVDNNIGGYFVSADNFSSIFFEHCVAKHNMFVYTLFENVYYGLIVVNRSTFTKNKIDLNSFGYCFVVYYNTNIHILDTNFQENQFQILQAEFNASVNFYNCQFMQNVINYCCIANIYYYGFVTIEKCGFFNNSVGNSTGLAVAIEYHGSLIVKDSMFTNNSGIDVGVLSVHDSSSASISNVSFVNNFAISGSCINIKNASVQVDTSSFYTQSSGIAISSTGSNLLLENCTFLNNSSPADSLIEMDNSTLNIIQCRIKNNAMGVEGGFLHSKQSVVIAQRSLFSNNSARIGSVFYLSQGSRLHITDSTMLYNTAIYGGCISSVNGVIKIKNTQFRHNKGINYGGAIYCDGSNITVENSSFIDHTSMNGGVFHITGGFLMAKNSVFRNNIINGFGNGAVMCAAAVGITLVNCMLNMNNAARGVIWSYHFNDTILRLSNTNFTSCNSCGPCWYFVLNLGSTLMMYTWKSNINIGNVQISSTNSTFLNQSIAHHMIDTEGTKMHWRELPFASGELTWYT